MAERRRRLAIRQHLARPARALEDVAGALVGLHSSDPVTPYLAARARVKGFTHARFEDAMYERRSLVRILGMRRTMFVVPLDLAGIVDASCTKDLVGRERKRFVEMVADQLDADPEAWLDDLGDQVCAHLADHGEATAAELSKAIPDLKRKISFGEGKRWAGQVGVSTRLLFLLATSGRIVRARPKGTWISSQYRWALTERWIGPLERWDPADARAELVRRWLATYGPGTETDLTWWTGWTKTRTRAALDACEAVEVDLDHGTGYVLSGDTAHTRSPGRWVALLPGLDPTVMAYKERDWFMGPLTPRLFDRNGNAGPTVWVDGEVVGGWAQRDDGQVTYEVLTDVTQAARTRIDREAGRLTAWLGESRVTPRFRTPLERDLAG